MLDWLLNTWIKNSLEGQYNNVAKKCIVSLSFASANFLVETELKEGFNIGKVRFKFTFVSQVTDRINCSKAQTDLCVFFRVLDEKTES